MKQVAGRDAVFLYIGKGGAASTVLSCNFVENPGGLPLGLSPTTWPSGPSLGSK